MWVLISALLSAQAPPVCECVCVDGLRKTQCATVRAARAWPSACGPDWLCPIVRPMAPTEAPGRQQPPDRLPQGESPQGELPPILRCPEVRVWRHAWGRFDSVRVCDAA